jgi:septum formation protein
MKQQIILASTSPRRRELLQQIGLDFKIMASNYEEDMTLKMSNIQLAKTLAHGKAREVADRLKSGIVIGSDTFIVFAGQRIGKPKNKQVAVETLRTISGLWLSVYSGLAIIDIKNGREVRDCELTKVKIKTLSESEISNYIKTGEPLDKAGAIAIQGRGAKFVEKINGCYSSTVGLPLYKLYINLQKLGVNI